MRYYDEIKTKQKNNNNLTDFFINLGRLLRFFFFVDHNIIIKNKIYGQPLFASVMLVGHFQMRSTLLRTYCHSKLYMLIIAVE